MEWLAYSQIENETPEERHAALASSDPKMQMQAIIDALTKGAD